jgi:protein-disulfide isomerase
MSALSFNRRALLAGLAATTAASAARAREIDEILGENGAKTPVWRLPSQISTDAPGAIRAGAKSPDVIVTEFFDYNCPWCKKSVADIDSFVRGDKNFRLILMQNAILSLGSVQCAKVVLATAAIAGDEKAYALHRALLSRKGQVEGLIALEEAARLKLDRAAIEARADSDEIRGQLKAQMAVARALQMEATPSFAINGSGVGGWPGGKAFRELVKALRKCDALAC